MYLASEFQLDWEESEPVRLTTDKEGVSGDIILDYTGKRLQFDGQFLGKPDNTDHEGFTADPPRRSGPMHADENAVAPEDEPSGEYRSPSRSNRPCTPEGTPDPIRRAPSTWRRGNSRHDFVAHPSGHVTDTRDSYDLIACLLVRP